MSAPSDPASSEAASPAPPDKTRPKLRRLRRWLLAAGIGLVAYTASGFLLAPRLLRNAIQEKGSAALRRQVTVAGVKVNPFTLALVVDGLAVSDRDAPRLAGWDSLYVRLAPWKLLRGAVGVAEIRLTRPWGRIALDASGRLNIQDLLDGDEPPPTPAANPAESTLAVALDRLEIEEARLVFEDRSRASAFETTLGPLTIRLSGFRTRGGADSPYAFSGTTEAGETFSWTGTILSSPLRSSGAIAFTGFQLPKYDPYLEEEGPGLFVESGVVSLEARYHLEWGATARRLSIAGLAADVKDLVLARRRDRSRAISIPHVLVSGADVDVLGHTAKVVEVKVLDARLTPRRDADGRMALVEMLEQPAAKKPRPPAVPWQWVIGAITIERASVELEDLVPPRPVRLSLAEVNVRLGGLTERTDVACPLTASLRWGDAGKAAATGTVWPYLARADLDVRADGLDLAPLGPYLDGAAPVRLAEARLGLALKTTVDAARIPTAWTAAGDVRLDGLALRHPTRDEELVRWRSLELLGVDADSARARASVKTVRLVEPRLRAVVFEDGTTSLASASGPAAAPAKAQAAAAPAGPSWRTSIGTFQLQRGRATFTDRSIQPLVLLSITDVDGRVTSLSSDPGVRSAVDLHARVNGEAPLSVTGTLNPLQAVAYTELAVAAKGIDLTPLDPYAGKHLGYGLAKGKLDLDVAYRVEDRGIRAGNVIRIDQLTLGDATHSKDATSLPVRLALALVTDRNGLILLDVPVEGRTDDPEFRLGRVIWRAVLNVLVKVATSPFAALASLVGGGDQDLSLVQFAPGSAELDGEARKRLELLARSLAHRPALSLELEPTLDANADPLALRRAELDRRLRRLKAAKLRSAPAGDALDALPLTPEERPRLVAELFAATFPHAAVPAKAPAAAPEPAPAGTDPEAQLLEAIALKPEDLPSLLAARQAVARDALLEAGVVPARIFTVQGGERAAKESGARVYFTAR